MATSACIVNQLQGIINELPLCRHMEYSIINTVSLRTTQILYKSPLLLNPPFVLYSVDISLYVQREETVMRKDRSLYQETVLATLVAAIHVDAYVHLDDYACSLTQYDLPTNAL